jgi:hypothetical protein
MSGQIIFFEKSAADFSNPNIAATASQGSDYALYALNRNDASAWITTGSVDADNTTWEVDFVDPRDVSEIIIADHNFKSFKVEYWDGSAYQAFPTAIDLTTNTANTNWFSFASTSASKIRVTVRGTQVADSDKRMFNFIATNLIGQLEGWPVISRPQISKNKQKTVMLSGRLSVAENVGAFSCVLKVANWKSPADLTVVETLFDSPNGFLVWLCGGDETQFSSVRQGYRLKDIPLMKCTNEYEPEWVQGLYKTGMSIELNLSEVVS